MNQHTFEYRRERMQYAVLRTDGHANLSSIQIIWCAGKNCLAVASRHCMYPLEYLPLSNDIHILRANTQGILKGIHTQADRSFENWRSNRSTCRFALGLSLFHYYSTIGAAVIGAIGTFIRKPAFIDLLSSTYPVPKLTCRSRETVHVHYSSIM
jgi:hypothetical protein